MPASETASQRTAPDIGLYFLKSGAETKFENSRVKNIFSPALTVNKVMLARTRAGSSPCLPYLNFDINKVIELGIKFPKFKSYFAEKINKIRRLEYLLQNRQERVKGETKEFLGFYIKHFDRQIINVCSWLENG